MFSFFNTFKSKKPVEPVLLKPGVKIKVEEIRCVLDSMDWECNSPPIGFLWARRLGDISPVGGMFIEGPREVVGIVNIIDNGFFPVKKSGELFLNVQDLESLRLLYHYYFPPQLTFFQKIKLFLKNKLNFRNK